MIVLAKSLLGGLLGAVGLAAFALTADLLLRWNPVADLFDKQDQLLARRR